ncbi:AbrB family transcriptional regulator [Clostridiaceae bacterium BL-3]|nr:AbrB family transcriptional regulator [Clostridiaceae bacterium BL-3]
MAGPEGKYAWTVKVGEKGQIVIPKEARDVFNIKPGDTLILLGDEEQGIAIPPQSMFSKLTKMIFDGKLTDSHKEEEK